MVAIKFTLVLVITALLVIACQQPAVNTTNTASTTNAAPPKSPAVTPTVDLAAEGKEIFATNCVICHKADGTGGRVTINGKPIDPDDLTTDKMKAMTDDKLIGYVTNGVVDEGMPAFKEKLSADEIKMVVAHVRTLQAN
jgi:mono/diheme cytochrome c family protein